MKNSLLNITKFLNLGGITSRLSPFTTPQDIGGLLTSNGFNLLTLDFDEIVISYPSIFELMSDVKGIEGTFLDDYNNNL